MTEPAGFSEQDVDDFSYNFDKWSDVVRGKVEIPEPSTDMVIEFFEQWYVAGNKANNFPREDQPKRVNAKGEEELVEESEDEFTARLQRNLAASAVAQAELRETHLRLISDVCRGPGVEKGEGQTPSIEDLRKLPHRVERAFEGYVMGKLSPQA